MSRRPAGAGNFLKLRRSLDEHLLLRRMTWNEFAMFVWLCLRANPADGVIRTSWPQLEIETHLSAKHAEQICRALRRKRYVWYPWHRGRRGQHRLIEVAINKYPTADGRYTDLSGRFATVAGVAAPASSAPGAPPAPTIRSAGPRRAATSSAELARNSTGRASVRTELAPEPTCRAPIRTELARTERAPDPRVPTRRSRRSARRVTPTRDELAQDPTRRAAIRIELALDPTPGAPIRTELDMKTREESRGSAPGRLRLRIRNRRERDRDPECARAQDRRNGRNRTEARARTDGRERPDGHDVAPGWREDMTVPVAIRELLAAQPWWRPPGHDGTSASLRARTRRGDRSAAKRRPRAEAWRTRRGDRSAAKRRARAEACRTRRGDRPAAKRRSRAALRRTERRDEPAPTRRIRSTVRINWRVYPFHPSIPPPNPLEEAIQ